MRMITLLKKYCSLLPIILIGQLIYGMSLSMVGTSLPYLSLRVDRSLPEMGFIFTAYGIAFMTASLVTGFVFCQLTQSKNKLLFLILTIIIMSLCRLVVPFLRSYTLLITVQVGMGIGSGMYDTSINSLVIYIFGPIFSRSITQFLHFGVSLGGFLGPAIMHPFIKQMGTIPIKKDYCFRHNTSTHHHNVTELIITASKNSTIFDNVPPLAYPYFIYELANVVTIIVYVSLIIFKFRLEKFVTNEDAVSSVIHSKRIVKYPKLLIMFVMIFYGLLCGQESMFWNMSFSYAICTKLNMTEVEAATLTTTFFIGFLSGRFSGIFVAKCIPPSVIVFVELLGCFIASTTLSIWGEENKILTFACFGIYGYAVSMVFASCISWLAEQMDVTGGASSSWFVGCLVSVSVFPPFIGYLFSTVGSSSFAYLVATISFTNLLTFIIMLIVSKFKTDKRDPSATTNEIEIMLSDR